MNYQTVYNSIIHNAKNMSRFKTDTTYYEKHHIVPRCLMGSDEESNLVLLTAKEHFICHKLLTKIHPQNNSIRHAYWMMCNVTSSNQKRYKVPSSSYERAKNDIRNIRAEIWKDRTKNPNYINPKLGEKNGMYGVHRFGVDNPFFGKSHTDDTKNKMRNTKKEYYKHNTSKTKDTIWINNGLTDKRHPSSVNIPEGYNKGRMKFTCPHCSLLVGGANAKRYHFDNCKSKAKSNDLSRVEV